MTEQVEGVTEPAAAVQQNEVQSDKEMNFRALREKLETVERNNQMSQLRVMELERSLQNQSQPQTQQTTYSDDDIPTWGELKKVRESELQEVNRLKEQLTDLRMRSRYTDYESTVKDYLPDVLQEDPDLALAIQNNPMMHRLAYKLAQSSPRYHQDKLAKANEATVNKIVDNASRTQPANARKNVMVQDEDARMAVMTDDQILAMFNMAKARS